MAYRGVCVVVKCVPCPVGRYFILHAALVHDQRMLLKANDGKWSVGPRHQFLVIRSFRMARSSHFHRE